MSSKELIIVGDSLFAQIAYEYFTYDSEYEVKGFAVEKEYRSKDKLFDLPVIDFEDIEQHYSPSQYCAFVALTYSKLNRTRSRLYKDTKKKGCKIASYIISKAFC